MGDDTRRTVRLHVVEDGDMEPHTPALPQADTWYVDPVHSTVGFTAGMQGLVRVRGRFGRVSGVVWVAEDPEKSSASVSVEAASIDTGIARRDEHLRSSDFLDVDRFPTIDWRGTHAEPAPTPGTWIFHGELTVKGITAPLPLTGSFLGEQPYPFGDATMIGLTGTARLDRFDFGIDAMPPVPGARLFVGRDVEIHLDVAMINSDIRFFTERFLSGRR